MIIIYHGRRPYLPLLACALHLGLPQGAEPFLPGDLQRNWRAAPLHIAGKDGGGGIVGCLVHGRHRGLYMRTLAGMAGLFGLSLAWVDLDKELADGRTAAKAKIFLADRWPAMFGERFRAIAAEAVRPALLGRPGGEP